MLDLKKKIHLLFTCFVVLLLLFQTMFHRCFFNKPWNNSTPRGGQSSDRFQLYEIYEELDVQNVSDYIPAGNVNKNKIMCWIMTCPENHRKKAVHVMATWGKRCDKILFSTESDQDSYGLPLLVVNTTSGRDHLTAKTMQTFDHLYKHYLDEFNWFLKADDDTYVIVENLRYFLSSKDPNEPIYFGHHFRALVKQGYLSGGGGYVLSKEALRRYGERKDVGCKLDGGNEDVEMSKCMEKLGVLPGKSVDAMERSRFHCFSPQSHIHGIYRKWYKSSDMYGGKKGIDSISNSAITFHYVTPVQMYNMELFIYHLQLYDGTNRNL